MGAVPGDLVAVGLSRPALVAVGVPTRGLAWAVERAEADPAAPGPTFAAGPSPRRLVRWAAPSGPTLVLGRAQPEAHVVASAAERLGVRVARRSSGGSAVLLQPGRQVWADVVIPAGDPLWHDDVGRAAWWVGQAWASALAALGVESADVHHGPMLRTPWTDRVCFAGVGSGEVTVGGRKVVGVAQRRTRGWALFQCAALLRWEAAPLAELLGLEAVESELGRVAAGLADLAVDVGVAEVEGAFEAALPRSS